MKAKIKNVQKELRPKQKKQGVKKTKKSKRAVKNFQKEKLSTMSNDSNNNLLIVNDGCNLEKPSERKQISTGESVDEFERNNYFNLRKRKKINYSVTRPDFIYESLYDSEYEDFRKKKFNRKTKNTKAIRTNFKKNITPSECRDLQIKSLLNWKNYKCEPVTKEKEYKYYEVDDVVSTNFEKYCQDLQCILINPPWSAKNPKFDFASFSKIKLPLKCMNEGLIFIWVERDLLSDVINYFENIGIKYVENIIWIKLNPTFQQSKKVYQIDLNSSNSNNLFNINDMYNDDNYEYFSKSKMTLLIFRKFKANKTRSLELRHQRTGDAVFDFVDRNIPYYRPYDYIYRLIEILLPKANYSENQGSLKLLEMYENLITIDGQSKIQREKDGYILFKNN